MATAPYKPAKGDGPAYDVMLGVTGESPQYGLLGDVSGRRVALDLNQTHTISLFGVQGGGKSYTLGTIAEMASLPIAGHQRAAAATRHGHLPLQPDHGLPPRVHVDGRSEQRRRAGAGAARRYGAEPRALSDVLLLAPADKVEERERRVPGHRSRPLKFAAAELQASHWRFLMGAVGNQATYIRQLNRIMKQLRDNLTLEGLRRASSTRRCRTTSRSWRACASTSPRSTSTIGAPPDVIRPGRLIIVDLRDEFIEKDEALGLFVVLLQLFAERSIDGPSTFNKLVVFDEAHKYIESPDLVAGLVEVVREMRHKGTSIMVASQDPPSVPVSLIELSSQIILHKFNSPAWLKHIQKANAALGALTPEKMAHLRPGEAFVWSSKATDEAFRQGRHQGMLSPPRTQQAGPRRRR